MKRIWSSLGAILVASAPAQAVVPISGYLRASQDVFIEGGNVRRFGTDGQAWAGTPENLINFLGTSVFLEVPFQQVRASTEDTATWGADGLSGSVEFDWTWTLASDGTLVGASFDDDQPNWSYTFKADRNGTLIWQGQIRPGSPFGQVPNMPFGLSGWNLTLNGQTVIDLYDPFGDTVRQGDRDFDLVAGETYTFALINESNIAGRNFTFEPFYQGNMLGEFFWLIQEAPVPEPGAWALMILGFGAAGAQLRRYRRSLAPTPVA